MRKLEGSVALVTGGGRGIGQAIALRLAADGARVVITGRDERALGETVGLVANAGGAARHVVGDVRDASHLEVAVARAIEVFGKLDVVVATAGLSGRVPLGTAPATAEAIVTTNLLGTYHTFHAAIPRMAGGGRLVATSGVHATLGAPGYAVHCASKAGILGLVRATAREVAARGITCNAVAPSWGETGMANVEPARSVPIQRAREPSDDVAELVAFLCSPAAAAITGQAIAFEGPSGPSGAAEP